ncbi:MAG: HAD family hydrolase [Alphaproteobacteria bacterium]|nr:MAG: HAD family hydrolase [Alphaproteobacteria bacterium]
MAHAKLLLFDCDGTLVDSQHMITTAMAEAFAMHGLTPPPEAAVRRVVGLSLAAAVARLLPEADGDRDTIMRLVEAYKQSFQRLRMEGREEPLYDGMGEVLEALASAGYVLGVATGKSTRGLKSVLSVHRLDHYFVTLQTADDHPGKPHPSMVEWAMIEAGAAPETTLVIGDTTYDMEMALAAKARGLGVSWGYHGPDELLEAGALDVLDAVPDIVGAVREAGL